MRLAMGSTVCRQKLRLASMKLAKVLSPGMPSSIGGTPKLSAISRAAPSFAALYSMSFGE